MAPFASWDSSCAGDERRWIDFRFRIQYPDFSLWVHWLEANATYESMEIKVDDLSGAAIVELLQEHLANMFLHSPPESVHALPIEKLRSPDVTFWSVWENGELLGCGALKQLEPRHGEIKSMRTVSRHLRKGVARTMLDHIINESKRRGYRRVSLETGSMAAFYPARRLYEHAGFTYCSPFGDYVEDPNSLFMTLEL